MTRADTDALASGDAAAAINGHRYLRQMMLPGFGPTAQAALARARVAVIGAGGLGSPVLHYLTAAGVGTLAVVDDDRGEVRCAFTGPVPDGENLIATGFSAVARHAR